MPSFNRRQPQCIIIFIDAVRPIVLAKVLPELFNGIELRGVWRQRYNGNIWRRFEVLAGVKACLVPDHHNMEMGIGFFFKFTKKGIHRSRIEVWTNQPDALAGLWTGSAKHIQILVLCLTPAAWPCALACPLSAKSSLLAEACLILKPYFYSLSRIISTDLPDLITDFFLNSSLATGSPLGCSGRLESQL